MAKTFVNPFHFIPLKSRRADSEMKAVAGLLRGDDKAVTTPEPPKHLLHDRYVGAYSGRIRCRLTTKSPGVFGNNHEQYALPNDEKRVTTRVDNLSVDGRAAIAGTSLKGMLSTLAEAVSGSAMRVLNNRVFSIRSAMSQARSAIGMIIEVSEGKNVVRKLLPLTLPTFKYGQPTYGASSVVWHEIREARRAQALALCFTSAYVKRTSAPDESFYFSHSHKVIAIPSNEHAEIEWDSARKQPGANQSKSNMLFNSRNVLRPYKHDSNPGKLPQTTLYTPGNVSQIPGLLRSLQKPDGANSGRKESTYDQFVPIPVEWVKKDGHFDFEAVAKELLLDAECAVGDST